MTGTVGSQSSENPNLVFVATKKSGRGYTFGYFATKAEIPDGWKLSPEMRDITDVMASMRCTKGEALVTMNDHWRR